MNSLIVLRINLVSLIILSILGIWFLFSRDVPRNAWINYFILIFQFLTTFGAFLMQRYSGSGLYYEIWLAALGSFICHVIAPIAHLGIWYIIYFTVTEKPLFKTDLEYLFCFFNAALAVICIIVSIYIFLNNPLSLLASMSFNWGFWNKLIIFSMLFMMLNVIIICIPASSISVIKTLGFIFLLSFPVYIAAAIKFFYPSFVPTYLASAIVMLISTIVQKVRADNRNRRRDFALVESQNRILLSQIHPHFIYNVLNSIYYLCDTDPQYAKTAISNFSDYLRINLSSLDKTKPIPFEIELEHVKTYLALEQMRFAEKLHVEFNIEATDFRIPSLSIQPLVENAVKHGIGEKETGGVVTISSIEENNKFVVCIEDNGVGFETKSLDLKSNEHVGLSNVRKRLKLLMNADLKVKSTINEGTKVTIDIPKTRDET